MVVLIYPQLTVDPDPGLSRRQRSRVLRAGNQVMGDYWQSQYLPLHWRTDARTRYRHTPRKPKYQAVKKRRARIGLVKRHGLVDNVYGGIMERMLRSSKVVRAYPTRVTITMRGPNYISMRPRDARKPHKAREITTVIPSEADVLRRKNQEKVEEGLNKIKARRTKKI